jgi:hypothetical protein
MRLLGLVFGCANSHVLIVERTQRSVWSAVLLLENFSHVDKENLAQFHSISPREDAAPTLPPVLFIEKNTGGKL